MSKRRPVKASAPPSPSPSTEEGGALAALLWAALFAALAFVPDQKILRWKLLALEAGTASALLTLALSWLRRTRAEWTRTPLDLPVALYAAGGLLFYALSPERGVSRPELVRILFSAAAFFAAAQTWPLLREPRTAPRVLAGAAGLLAAYALLQPFGGIGILQVPRLERPIATFGNPIFLAAFLAASLPSALALALDEETLARRTAAGVSALLCAGALWAAQSRAAFAGLVFAGALFGIMILRGRARIVTLSSAALFAALALWLFRGREWTHGLIWRDALALWRAHPLIGCGLGRFHVEFPAYASEALRALWPEQKVIVNFAHNEYLQTLCETGLVGLLLFLAVPAAALRRLAPAAGAPPVPRWALGALLGAAALFGQAVFSPDLRFGVSAFLLFALLGGAASAAGRREPLPTFPGRFAGAAILALATASWAWLAAAPALANRRLAREPGFHVEQTPELRAALDELEVRLRAEPANGDLAEHLAWLYAKARRWERAVPLYEQAALHLPGRPGPLNNLGNIAYTVGKREEAISWWERSLAVDDGQVDAHLNLGKTLYETGRLKEAAAHLQKVLVKDPSNEKAQVLLKKMVE